MTRAETGLTEGAASTEPQELSPSSIAYLFADRFVVAAKPGTKGMRSYATGGVVDRGVLATNLPIVALWSLRESGSISLEPYSEKRLGLFKAEGVRARAVGTVAANGGLEGSMAKKLNSSSKAADPGEDTVGLVKDLVAYSDDPYGALLASVLKQLASAGFLTEEKHDVGVVRRLKGELRMTYEPLPSGYDALRDRASDLSSAWGQFHRGESELYGRLVKAVGKGLEAKRRSDDDGPDWD